MSKKDIFRTTVFGGYQKEDVMDYIRSLENENETIRILNKKENSGIKAQLEKEIAAGNELREALARLKEENSRLEAEKEEAPIGMQEPVQAAANTEAVQKARVEADQRWKEEVLDRDTRLQELLTELKKSNEALEEELKKEIRQLREYMSGLTSEPEPELEPEPASDPETSSDPEPEAAAEIEIEIPEPEREPERKPEEKLPEAVLAAEPEEQETETGETPEQEEEEEEDQEEEESEAEPAEEENIEEQEEQEEPDPDHGYHEKAYQSLRDIKEKAAGLLASLEDTGGFGL